MKGKVAQAFSPLFNCLPTIRRSSKQANEQPVPPANGPSAGPSTRDNLTAKQQENLNECAEYFKRKTSDLQIVKTTYHPNGRIIDWIPINSQGPIAQAPPPPTETLQDPKRKTQRPLAELEFEGAERGPVGTVPIPRQNIDHLDANQTLKQRLSKAPPPNVARPVEAEDDAGVHWYASSGQLVSNHGGVGTFSVFKPYVQSNADFSLLQTAVIRQNVPKPGSPSTLVSQTVEAGWINYPAQIGSPHLFTFYTTNGYSSIGNNQSGWNRDVTGWVQVDGTIFPGTVFAPNSTDGGTQYELTIRYYLYQGNWWLRVGDTYIGYYPGSLFSANESNAGATLATSSDLIDFYGEIYNSETTQTTTDMGSGRFPETGWTHSAYIREIAYTNTSDGDVAYNGSAETSISDSNRYRSVTDYSGTSSWGSYMYLGGPGAGGVTGG